MPGNTWTQTLWDLNLNMTESKGNDEAQTMGIVQHGPLMSRTDHVEL